MMIAKHELLQRCAVVQTRPTHERERFQSLSYDGDIGIQPYTERVCKIFLVDDSGIGIHESSCKGAFDRLSGIMRQLERIPGIVIAIASSYNSKRHPPPGAQYAVDNFMNRAIATHDDDGTPFLSGAFSKYFRLSPPRCFYVLCMFPFRTVAHHLPIVCHITTIGCRVKDHQG